jgi:hypothetical protein
MKKIFAAFLFLFSASLLSAQSNISTISGMLPQLPSSLGANGGLKVECLSGCGGGGATEARQSGSTIYDGSLTATTTASAIAGSQAITKVLIRSDPSNAVNVLCGNATTQNTILEPGDGLSLEITNLNLLFCKSASATASVSYIAR